VVVVEDDDVPSEPTLTLTPSDDQPVDDQGRPVTIENGDPVELVLTRSGPNDQPLSVMVFNNDSTELSVPFTVTIPAGQNSVTFLADPVDDLEVDGTQVPTLFAFADGFPMQMLDVVVQDDDVIVDNHAPIAVDDEAKTLADTPVSIDLLENDSDPDGDPISVTSISDNDEEVGLGGTITLDSGAIVTLGNDGTVTYDGSSAFADLLVGTDAVDEFLYIVEDDKGASDIGDVTVTVCGTLNTKESISDSLNDSGSAMVFFPEPANQQTYKLAVMDLVLNEGEANEIDLTGNVFDAWCIDIDGRVEYLTTLDGDWFSSTDAGDLAALEANGQINDADAIDEVNWILNNTESLYADGFDFFDIQNAVWELVDGRSAAADGSPDDMSAEAIVELAEKFGSGYMPEDGGIFGVIFAPTDPTQTNDERGQTFILGVEWDQLESDPIC